MHYLQCKIVHRTMEIARTGQTALLEHRLMIELDII